MIEKKKTGTTVDNWKKKKWYTLIAPESFQQRELGQTPANTPMEVEKRNVNINLMALIGSPKKQNTTLTFAITKVQGDKAQTVLLRYQIAPASVKRMIRREKTRVDDSFVCKTKEGKLVRMKPLLITRALVSRKISSVLRRTAKHAVVREVSKLSYDGLTQSLVDGKLQKDMRTILSKLYPLSAAEIRMMETVVGEYKGKIEEPLSEPKNNGKIPEADLAAQQAGESDAEEAVHETQEAIAEESEEDIVESQE